jgi:ubiquinone/menaquinone biosynthesis C-methylase UbiE
MFHASGFFIANYAGIRHNEQSNNRHCMLEQTQKFNQTKIFYDQIADVHNLSFKINGYRQSLEKYLIAKKLDLPENFQVLDAGCGTGMMTSALYGAGLRPLQTVAFDLSSKSLNVARKEFIDDKKVIRNSVRCVQGNILSMPFDDNSFDLILTCGVLEYVPLDEGFAEIARVLKPEGFVVFIPIRPSLLGKILERIYSFKAPRTRQVIRTVHNHFNIVEHHTFPIVEPISWSKNLFLLQKS